MRTVVYNHNNLKENEVTNTITRVKIMLVNSTNQIILAKSNNTYHLPGGHLESNETLLECIERELKEETGIILKNLKLEPFLLIEHFCKNHPEVGINNLYKIYYYTIKTDEEINYDQMNFTDDEKKGNFELHYINLNELEQTLIDNIPNNPINELITKEIIEALKVYRELYQ